MAPDPTELAALRDGDLLAWSTKLLVPAIKHLLDLAVRKAVADAERPLRARVAELEAELRRTRDEVAKAVKAAA